MREFETNKYVDIIDKLYHSYDDIINEGINKRKSYWINASFIIVLVALFISLLYNSFAELFNYFITPYFYVSPYFFNVFYIVLIPTTICFYYLKISENNRKYKYFNIELKKPYNQYRDLVDCKFEKDLIKKGLLYNNKHYIDLVVFYINTIEKYINKSYKKAPFIAKQTAFIIFFITCFISTVSFVYKDAGMTLEAALSNDVLMKQFIGVIILLAIIFFLCIFLSRL